MNDTITVVGNVGQEPERREIGNGVSVTKFSVACTQRRYDAQQRAWVDAHTNWFQVNAFRGLGDHAFASIRKGHRVIVTGRLRVRTWENDAGRGTAVEIEADAVGHDLQWATTEYRPVSRPAPAPATDPGAEQSPSERTAGDWGAPAAPVDQWAVTTPGRPEEGAPAPAREPVAVGAETGETPF